MANIPKYYLAYHYFTYDKRDGSEDEFDPIVDWKMWNMVSYIDDISVGGCTASGDIYPHEILHTPLFARALTTVAGIREGSSDRAVYQEVLDRWSIRVGVGE